MSVPFSVLRASLSLVAALGISDAGRAADDGPPEKLQKQVLKAGIYVFLPKGEPVDDKWEFEAATGFVIDAERRLVLTSKHVIQKKTKVTVFYPQFAEDKLITERLTYLKQAKSGDGISAEVLATNAKTDLALLRLSTLPKEAVALSLAKKSAGVKSRVHSMGNPAASTELWRFTSWKVQGVAPLRVQTDAGPLETLFVYTPPFEKLSENWGPGASGGPVVNDDGEVVGLMYGMLTVKDKSCGGFIDVSVLQDFLKQNKKIAEK
jgi:S1-C subfamily serine protease